MVRRFGGMVALAVALGGTSCAQSPVARTQVPAARAPRSQAAPQPVSEPEWRGACSLPWTTRSSAFQTLLRRDEQATNVRRPHSERAAWLARKMVDACGCDDVVGLTRRMLSFQTVAALPADERQRPFQEMESWLVAWAAGAGLRASVFGERDAWEVIVPGRSEERAIRLVTHADVAPVNDPPALLDTAAIPEGWSVPAFQATMAGGRLYGRGAEDDKGAIAASLVALGAVRASGLEPDGELVLAIGTAEEEAWEGMHRYAEQSKPSRATVCIDSSYPVVTSESGFVQWGIRLSEGKAPRGGNQPVVRALHAGLFLTQVPDHGYVELVPRGETASELAARASQAADDELRARRSLRPGTRYRIDVRVEPSNAVRIDVAGVSAHASVPLEGENAIWPLASVLVRLNVAQGGARAMAGIIEGEFDGEHGGQRLGIAYSDSFMGPLLVVPSKLRMERGEVLLEVNMRRPVGRSKQQFVDSLQQSLDRLRKTHAGLAAIDDIYVGDPHSVDPSSPLVRTLLNIYRDTTGQQGRPLSIPGGTYARLFEGGVDFGPSMPGKPYMGHAADEYVEVEGLCKTTRMLLEVLLRGGAAASPER